MTKKLRLFFDEEFQHIIDSFAYCFKIKISIFSSHMEDLIVGLQNPGSRFCQMVQKEIHLYYRCCHQDKLMLERCSKKDSLLVYRCFAGPSEAIFPIKIDQAIVGYGMLGQFRTSKGPSDEMLALWTKAGYKKELLAEAFNEMPFYDQTSLDNIFKLFSSLISYVVNSKHMFFRRPSLVEQVNHWLDDHIAKPVTLEEIAADLGLSRSAISNNITKKFGVSFKQLLIRKRIERFESIILTDPDTTIQEAAEAVGYDDPLYFSRIYKKVRYVPPSTYISTLRITK